MPTGATSILSEPTVERLAGDLFGAFESGVAIEPLTASEPSMTVADAYRIQAGLMSRHAAAGRTRVGRKIGLTSEGIQKQLGVDSPDFGALLSTHVFDAGTTVSISALNMILPRIEAEVAFILDRPLQGPGVSAADVLAVTRSLVPVFELVDSRIRDWKITLADTISDNASCLGAVLGEPVDPASIGPLSALTVAFGRDGEVMQRGQGSAVMGDPAAAVAWLANQLAEYGDALPAGEPILSGSFTPTIDIVPGLFEASFGPKLGTVSVQVTA
ncbi:MAG: 2-keto-4-pentenoate hydratase [Solirubrobacteraceae bacterium]